MSTLKVNQIKNNGSAVDLPVMFMVAGLVPGQGYSESSTEPSNPSNGDFWWDTANELLYQHVNGSFIQLAASLPPAWTGPKSVMAGGHNGTGYTADVQYVNIATPGNATDWGADKSGTSYGKEGASTGGGGIAIFAQINAYMMMNIATTGNAGSFAATLYDTTDTRSSAAAAASDGTYQLLWHGSGFNTDHVIEKLGFATLGTATLHGTFQNDGSQTYVSDHTAMSDGVYTVSAGGSAHAFNETRMNRTSFGTEANATDFGNLSVGRAYLTSVGDETYGVMAGGYNNSRQNVMDYITLATTGNATDFGDLWTPIQQVFGSSDLTTGVIAGGYYGADTNTISKITIATPANSTDFGDLIGTLKSAYCTSG